MKKLCSLFLVCLFILSAMAINTLLTVNANNTFDANNLTSVQQLRNSLKLTWNDEFNGTTIDKTKWKYEGSQVHRNGESQVYADNDAEHNAWCEDGKLVIEARKENRHGYKYTSACLRGDVEGNPQTTMYGMKEARIMFDSTGPGLWPAFWMKGYDAELPWPITGEIDIMENMGSLGNCDWITSSCIHYSPKKLASNHETACKYTYDSGKTLAGEWHTYGVYYDDKQLFWYVDDEIKAVFDISDPKYYFFRTYGTFFLLNFALEGNGGSGISKERPLPDDFTSARMYVDYVRVYQSEGDGPVTIPSSSSQTNSSSTTTPNSPTQPSSNNSSPTDDTMLIDWSNYSNYYLNGNLGSRDDRGITFTSSVSEAISTWNNNLAGFDGLKFSVHANSNNTSQRMRLKIGDVETPFVTLNQNGDTEFQYDFSELNINPANNMDIKFQFEGNVFTDVVISDVVAYVSGKESTSSTAPTNSTKPTTSTEPQTTTPTPTKPTTSTQPQPTTPVPTKPTTSTNPQPTTPVPTKPITSTKPQPTVSAPTKPTTTTEPQPTTSVQPKPTNVTSTTKAPTIANKTKVKKPPKIKRIVAIAKKRKVDLLWGVVSVSKKYEIRYSYKRNMKSAKIKTVKKTYTTLKKLKSGKTVYIQVRAVNGSAKSKWSVKKSVKVK